MSNDNERFFDNADAKQDDELSTDELDNVAGGASVLRGPEAFADKGRVAAAGPEAFADKGRFAAAGPEDAGDKGFHTKGPESAV